MGLQISNLHAFHYGLPYVNLGETYLDFKLQFVPVSLISGKIHRPKLVLQHNLSYAEYIPADQFVKLSNMIFPQGKSYAYAVDAGAEGTDYLVGMGSLELRPVFHCYLQRPLSAQAYDFIPALGILNLFK